MADKDEDHVCLEGVYKKDTLELNSLAHVLCLSNKYFKIETTCSLQRWSLPQGWRSSPCWRWWPSWQCWYVDTCLSNLLSKFSFLIFLYWRLDIGYHDFLTNTSLETQISQYCFPLVTKLFQICCLYFFICSLSFLADSFRMVGGRSLGGKRSIFWRFF